MAKNTNTNKKQNTSDGWGSSPQSGGGQKRDVPYIEYSAEDTDICQFVPFSDIAYHLTIPLINGWSNPVEAWTHDVIINGKFWGNVFCKNTYRGADDCEFCRKNAQAEQQAGRTLQNKERPAPLKKKLVFPVIVDEIPEKPFLIYKISEKFMQQIAQQFQLAGTSDIKLVLKRTGTSMQDTTYTVANSGQPTNPKVIASAGIPTVTTQDYKDFLISLEDFEKLGILGTQPVQGTPSNQGQDQQSGGSWGTGTPKGAIDNGQQEPDNTSDSSDDGALTEAQVQEAENFIVKVGPFAGKKLDELDDEALKKIAQRMTGDIQNYASILLNVRINGVPF